MATTLRGPVLVLDPATITVDQIKTVRFATTFRGYDPAEVKLHLDSVATAYQMMLDTEADLRARLNGEEPPGEVNPFVSGVRTVDLRSVGMRTVDLRTDGVVIVDAERAEVDRGIDGVEGADGIDHAISPTEADLLTDARRGAEEILVAARNEANALVAKANDEAARIILRARAESRGRATSADGMAVVEAALNDSQGDPALAREQARMMIEEAKVVRERILADLSKRRRVAHVQLEQMRVAREKLVESLREAKRRVDEASRDLSTAEVEARIAADAAGRKVNSEPLPSAAELEIELLSTRHLDSPLPRQSVEPLVVDDVVVVEDVVVEDVVVEDVVVMVDDVVVVEDVVVEDVVVEDLVVDAFVEDVVVVVDDVVVVEDVVVDVVVEDVVVEDVVVDVVVVKDVVVAGGAASEVVVEATVETAPVEAIENVVGKPNVEELFARLRREREEAAEAARKTLGTKAVERDTPARVIDLTTYESGANATEPADAKPGKAKKRSRTKAETVGAVSIEGSGDRTIHLLDTDDAHLDEEFAPVLRPKVKAASVEAAEPETQLTYVLGSLREQLVRSIKRVMQDEQSIVLSALRTSSNARSQADLDRLVGDAQEHPQKFYVVLEPALGRAFRAGVDRQGGALADIGSGIDVVEGPTVHVESITVARTIVDVLRNDLRAEFERVSSPEADSSLLINSVSSRYRAWTTDRISELVEPALRTAYLAGTSARTSS